MICDNCGKEDKTVKETDLGELCKDCYWILFGEHFDIVEGNELEE